MIKTFGIIFGAGALGGLLGWGLYEAVSVVKDAKKMEKDYPDIKLLERLKIAARERVAAIKSNTNYISNNIIFILSNSFMAAYGFVLGMGSGYGKGWYDGIGDGADKLIQALSDKCPHEFKKFIEIITKKGLTRIPFYEETCRDNSKRGYSWEPMKNTYIKLKENLEG